MIFLDTYPRLALNFGSPILHFLSAGIICEYHHGLFMSNKVQTQGSLHIRCAFSQLRYVPSPNLLIMMVVMITVLWCREVRVCTPIGPVRKQVRKATVQKPADHKLIYTLCYP